MDLYFLRHASALQRGIGDFPDDDRPLTEEGIRKMKQCGKGIAKLLDGVDLILSSPLIRAFETAQIAARSLNFKKTIETCVELLPGADFEAFIALIKRLPSTESLLFVGHEPNMSKVISSLLGSNRVLLEIRKGGFCRIGSEQTPARGTGTLLFHLTPKQLRLIAK